jgi:hypothetical protein
MPEMELTSRTGEIVTQKINALRNSSSDIKCNRAAGRTLGALIKSSVLEFRLTPADCSLFYLKCPTQNPCNFLHHL